MKSEEKRETTSTPSERGMDDRLDPRSSDPAVRFAYELVGKKNGKFVPVLDSKDTRFFMKISMVGRRDPDVPSRSICRSTGLGTRDWFWQRKRGARSVKLKPDYRRLGPSLGRSPRPGWVISWDSSENYLMQKFPALFPSGVSKLRERRFAVRSLGIVA